jgi:pyruvate/2-oxoglutarate/acetoin dehydrogenase E1 component
MFLQVPGLKVALPSTPADAKGLLKSAVRDENPVLVIEGGVLYRTKGNVPDEEYTTPFGVADVKRKGDDATIVAFSRMVGEAITAADKLEKDGISVEVIDPRTIRPLDTETIVESLKRTGRLVVASDDVKSGGLGAEVCALAVESAFDYLDAPIQRVSSPDLPVPFSPELERQYMPDSTKLVEAVKSVV